MAGSGHLVLQKILPTYFSTEGVSFSTNGHRTATDRLIPDTAPLVVTATTTLHVDEPKAVVINNVGFRTDRSGASELHTPEEPPAYKMNARLWIPTYMRADHEGRPLRSEAKQPPSLDTILEEATEHSDDMARKYPKSPVTQMKAVDDVIRRSETISREENVDPEVAAARQWAEVPSTIDPVKLYRKVATGFSTTHLSADEEAPSIEPITDKLRASLETGMDPLRAHYEAAKAIIVLEWNHQVETKSEAVREGKAAIQHERGHLSATLEHRRAMAEILSRLVKFDGKPLRSTPTYTHY